MICEKCLHNRICYMQEICNDLEQHLKEFGCEAFDNRSEWVHLPHKQKEEIEKLKSKNKILSRNADNAFQEGLNERRELFEPEIKSEAYKEFAERLKEKYYNIVLYGKIVTTNMIDNLLKEMVGEEK